MGTSSALRRIAAGFGCIFLGISLCGVNYCQKSYSFMEQVNLAATATPTGEPTETPDGTITPDEETPEPDETPTVTPTASATSTVGVAAAGIGLDPLFRRSAVLQSLSDLSRTTPQQDAAPRAAVAGAGSVEKAEGNWLGQIGRAGSEAGFKDSDGDGYADWLELQSGSDPNAIESGPRISAGTSLERRMKLTDTDMDGLSDAAERDLGTSQSASDTDGDGVSDGAEVLSGSDPRDPAVLPADTDKDGLSDGFERRIGISSYSADSDRDGVSDGIELAIGSDPLSQDTDGDGISDGREMSLGTDPAQIDFERLE